MIKFKLLVLSFISLIFIQKKAIAQNELIDSLRAELKKEKSTFERIEDLTSMSRAYRRINFDSSKRYADLALEIGEISENLKGQALALRELGVLNEDNRNYDDASRSYKRGLALARIESEERLEAILLFDLGNLSFLNAKLDSADLYYDSAIHIYGKLNQLEAIAKIEGNKGLILFELGKPLEAIDVYLSSIDKYKKVGDLRSLANTYTWIGNIYFQFEFFEKAGEFYNKSLNTALVLKDKSVLNTAVMNYGMIQYLKDAHDSAQYYFEEGLLIAKSLESNHSIADAYINLGQLYVNLGQFEKAKSYTDSVFSMIKEDIYIILSANYIKGQALYRTGNLPEGIKYLEKAWEEALRIKSQAEQKRISFQLSRAYALSGKTKQAVYHFDYYDSISKVILNRSSSATITYYTEKFESEEKDRIIAEQEIERAEQENEKLRRNSFILLLVALALTLLIIIIISKNKLKAVYGRLNRETEKSIKLQIEKLDRDGEYKELLKLIKINIDEIYPGFEEFILDKHNKIDVRHKHLCYLVKAKGLLYEFTLKDMDKWLEGSPNYANKTLDRLKKYGLTQQAIKDYVAKDKNQRRHGQNDIRQIVPK